MTRLWIPIVTLAALALPLAAQESGKKADSGAAQTDKKSETKKVESLKLGDTVDEKVVMRDLDGKEYKFKDLRGKVVFIHFWSTVCPYEPAAHPKFHALMDRYKGKDVVQFGVASNQNELGPEPPKDSPKDMKEAEFAKVREQVKATKIAYPIIVDRGNKISDLLGGRTTPHCFVIDKKGVIVYAGGLDDDPKGDKGEAAKTYVRDAIDAVLAGTDIKVKESKPYG
jgi:thiol-disulfide isomerase/thioredoxin